MKFILSTYFGYDNLFFSDILSDLMSLLKKWVDYFDCENDLLLIRNSYWAECKIDWEFVFFKSFIKDIKNSNVSQCI